ncbi:MAG: MCP four helix bundle domain-containing protein, partial [Desulfuromonadaceae bacterium]
MAHSSPEGRNPTGSAPAFTLVKKIIAGYLLIVLFSLISIGYALTSLHRQTTQSEQLVAVDFKALTLLRSLRQTLLAQENLTRQYVILKDQTFSELLNRRHQEFDQQWLELVPLLDLAEDQNLQQQVHSYQTEAERCQQLLSAARWQEAEACAQKCDPLRKQLQEEVSALFTRQDEGINRQLSRLTANSRQAYKITWLLVALGIIFSAPAVSALVFSISR